MVLGAVGSLACSGPAENDVWCLSTLPIQIGSDPGVLIPKVLAADGEVRLAISNVVAIQREEGVEPLGGTAGVLMRGAQTLSTIPAPVEGELHSAMAAARPGGVFSVVALYEVGDATSLFVGTSDSTAWREWTEIDSPSLAPTHLLDLRLRSDTLVLLLAGRSRASGERGGQIVRIVENQGVATTAIPGELGYGAIGPDEATVFAVRADPSAGMASSNALILLDSAGRSLRTLDSGPVRAIQHRGTQAVWVSGEGALGTLHIYDTDTASPVASHEAERLLPLSTGTRPVWSFVRHDSLFAIDGGEAAFIDSISFLGTPVAAETEGALLVVTTRVVETTSGGIPSVLRTELLQWHPCLHPQPGDDDA